MKDREDDPGMAPAEPGDLTAVDVETTGLDPVRDRIVEIAALQRRVDGTYRRFATLMNPGRPVPARARAVHGLGDDELAVSPGPDVVLPAFLAFIGRSRLVAHNARFDKSFLDAALGRAGLGSLPAFEDTLLLARRAFPGKRSYSLARLTAELGLAGRVTHRAEADAAACLELYDLCRNRLNRKGPA